MRTSTQKGFTLIELLVVISIISVLTSVAYASYGTVKAKTRDTKRAADTVQLRTALSSYEIDHGGVPSAQGVAGCAGTPTASPTTWTCTSQAGLNAALTPLVNGHYISAIPTDPSNTGGLTYYYSTGATTGTDPSGTPLAQNASFNYVSETQTTNPNSPVILGVNVGMPNYTAYTGSGYPVDVGTGGGIGVINTTPTLTGFTGPTTLSTNVNGTWTINMSNPGSKTLTYAIDWGDGATDTKDSSTQSVVFSHAYSSSFPQSDGTVVWVDISDPSLPAQGAFISTSSPPITVNDVLPSTITLNKYYASPCDTGGGTSILIKAGNDGTFSPNDKVEISGSVDNSGIYQDNKTMSFAVTSSNFSGKPTSFPVTVSDGSGHTTQPVTVTIPRVPSTDQAGIDTVHVGNTVTINGGVNSCYTDPQNPLPNVFVAGDIVLINGMQIPTPTTIIDKWHASFVFPSYLSAYCPVGTTCTPDTSTTSVNYSTAYKVKISNIYGESRNGYHQFIVSP